MSATSGIQISKPAHEQVFEDNCVILWKNILKDPNVQKVGRRGQKQLGVDLYGYRDGDRDYLVGLQCKLKTGNKKLKEQEVRDEYAAALTFVPRPKEYFILTTADDDQSLQALARTLTAEQAKAGIHMACYVWGWGTLCDEASQHPQALHAFDPTYGPHGKLVLQKLDEQAQTVMRLSASHDRVAISIEGKLDRVLAAVNVQPGGPTSTSDPVEAHLDREIDGYRELANKGSPAKSMVLFEQLLATLDATASGRIVFRIKANIGSCLIALGRIDEGSDKLLEAFAHAPDEPRAIGNKALGLLLKGHWQDVLEMGKDQFGLDVADEHFWSVVIQAAKADGTITDPHSLVPVGQHSTAAVTVAIVDFVRSREDGAAWWRAAHEAVKRFPDQHYLRQFAADAAIEESGTSATFQVNGRVEGRELARLEAATKTLAEFWEDDLSSDVQPDEESIGVLSNLIVGLRLLGQMTEAVHRVKQGIAAGAKSSAFHLRAAVVAMETRHTDLDLAQLLSRVDDSPDKRMLEAQHLLVRGKWGELSTYSQDDIKALPSTERLPFAMAVRVAQISTGSDEDVPDALRTLIASDHLDIRSLVVIADFASAGGHMDIADEAYQSARSMVDDQTHFSGRYMLARHALSRDLWSDAADLLMGRVNTDVDTDILRDLVTALVNERPPRQRALGFFKSLSPKVRRLERYRHAEGFLHFYRGDLKLAEAAMMDARPANRVDGILLLLRILREQEKDSQAEDLLRSVVFSDVEGDAGYRMILLQELIDVGRGQEALDTGYRLVREHRNDADVVMKYFGLMFRSFDDGQIVIPSQVAEDTSFRIEDEDGKSIWLTIEGSQDRVAEGVVSSSHAFAAPAIGQEVGHTFELQHGFSKTVRWTIKEVKNKYLHLFHQVMESFEDEFPGVRGISSLSLEDGDFEPVFEQVRRIGEQAKTIVEMYTDRRAPLAVVAASINKDAISFAAQIRAHGHDIFTCVGQHAERAQGFATVAEHRGSGAVLDSYTAWTAAELGLFDVLKSVFGRLIIPRSILHELESFLGEAEYDEKQSMSLGWHDGQYYRYLNTREDFDARRDYIATRVETIKGHCEVETIDAPDGKPEASKVVAMFGSEPFNPAALAGSGYVLISEDYLYRNWAEFLWSAKGAWLQAVLDFAGQSGMISMSRYADLVGQLAEKRHGFVYWSGVAINALIGDGSATNWTRVKASLQYIGTKEADMESHLETVASFVDIARSAGSTNTLHFEKALGLLLESLVRGRDERWPEILFFVYVRTDRRVRKYLLEWMKGHFLDPAPMFAIHREFVRHTSGSSILIQ